MNLKKCFKNLKKIKRSKLCEFERGIVFYTIVLHFKVEWALIIKRTIMNYRIFSLALLMAGTGLFATNPGIELEKAIYNADLDNVMELLDSGYNVNVACGGKLPIHKTIVNLFGVYHIYLDLEAILEKVKRAEQTCGSSGVASEMTYDLLKPSINKIGRKLVNLSKIGTELLRHGSEIEKDSSKNLEEIISNLCPKKSCWICPQPKESSFCPDLREFSKLYEQRLAKQNSN